MMDGTAGVVEARKETKIAMMEETKETNVLKEDDRLIAKARRRKGRGEEVCASALGG